MYLSLLFQFILSVRLSNNLWGSDVLLFLEFINIVPILFYNFIEFIILLYTFLVIFLARFKECMIWRILSSKFSDVLPTVTCARAIGSFWSIYWGVPILSPFMYNFGYFILISIFMNFCTINRVS